MSANTSILLWLISCIDVGHNSYVLNTSTLTVRQNQWPINDFEEKGITGFGGKFLAGSSGSAFG